MTTGYGASLAKGLVATANQAGLHFDNVGDLAVDIRGDNGFVICPPSLGFKPTGAKVQLNT